MPAVWRYLILFTLLAFAPRLAQADEVDDLISTIREKPADMDPLAWREARRDAARQLGQSDDPRAEAVLIEVARDERFDIIVEIAIDGLADSGSSRARDTLAEIAGDSSRDDRVRDKARAALAQIGEAPANLPSSERSESSESRPVHGSSAPPGAIDGDSQDSGPTPKTFDADVIAAAERLTFAAGAARIEYDTLRNAPLFDGHARASFSRVVERARVGYNFGGDLELAAGAIDFEEEGAGSKIIASTAEAFGEARFYLSGSQFFGLVGGAAAGSLSGVSIARPDDEDTEELLLGGDLTAVIGPGYGRVIDVSESLRLDRIEDMLAAAGLLGRPLSDAARRRMLGTWWALRDERGAHRRLVATIEILRESGALLADPDPTTTYKLLQILTDGALTSRISGFRAHVGIAESFVARDDFSPVEEGRIETVIASATYASQLDDGVAEVVGTASARRRIFGDDGAPTPWLARATLSWRRFFYTDVYDPLGALELSADVAASDDGIGDDDNDPANASATGFRIGGRAGWLFFPNRASRIRLAADVAMVSGELFLGVSLSATYGFLDASFAVD